MVYVRVFLRRHGDKSANIVGKKRATNKRETDSKLRTVANVGFGPQMAEISWIIFTHTLKVFALSFFTSSEMQYGTTRRD